MKKLIVVLICVCLLAGCGAGSAAPSSAAEKTPAESTVTETTGVSAEVTAAAQESTEAIISEEKADSEEYAIDFHYTDDYVQVDVVDFFYEGGQDIPSYMYAYKNISDQPIFYPFKEGKTADYLTLESGEVDTWLSFTQVLDDGSYGLEFFYEFYSCLDNQSDETLLTSAELYAVADPVTGETTIEETEDVIEKDPSAWEDPNAVEYPFVLFDENGLTIIAESMQWGNDPGAVITVRNNTGHEISVSNAEVFVPNGESLTFDYKRFGSLYIYDMEDYDSVGKGADGTPGEFNFSRGYMIDPKYPGEGIELSYTKLAEIEIEFRPAKKS